MPGRRRSHYAVLLAVVMIAAAALPVTAVTTPDRATHDPDRETTVRIASLESTSPDLETITSTVLEQENGTEGGNDTVGDDGAGNETETIGNDTAAQPVDNETVGTAAQEGATDALADLEAMGIESTDEQRTAVIDAAVVGAEDALAEAQGAETGEVADAVTRDLVYAAAYGAAGGSAFALEETPVSVDGLRASTAGSIHAAILIGAVIQVQGIQPSETVIYETAFGGAEGAAAQYGILETDETLYVDAEQADYAAYGGTAGALMGMTATPETDPLTGNLTDHAYYASGGSAMGAIWGANERAAEAQPPDPSQTEMAATGAASGTVTGVIQRPSTDTNRTLNSSFDVAAGALMQSELGEPNAIYEQTFSTAFESIVGAVDEEVPIPEPDEVPDAEDVPAPDPDEQPNETVPDQLPEPNESPPIESEPVPIAPFAPEEPAAGNEVFPEPLVVGGIPVGPPQDLTGDGLYEDVAGDGSVTYLDVVRLSQIHQAHMRGELALTEAQMAAFDFNSDGVFDDRDIHALDERIAQFDEYD